MYRSARILMTILKHQLFPDGYHFLLRKFRVTESGISIKSKLCSCLSSIFSIWALPKVTEIFVQLYKEMYLRRYSWHKNYCYKQMLSPRLTWQRWYTINAGYLYKLLPYSFLCRYTSGSLEMQQITSIKIDVYCMAGLLKKYI